MTEVEVRIKMYHSKVAAQYFNSAYYYWCKIMGLEETLDIVYSNFGDMGPAWVDLRGRYRDDSNRC